MSLKIRRSLRDRNTEQCRIFQALPRLTETGPATGTLHNVQGEPPGAWEIVLAKQLMCCIMKEL